MPRTSKASARILTASGSTGLIPLSARAARVHSRHFFAYTQQLSHPITPAPNETSKLTEDEVKVLLGIQLSDIIIKAFHGQHPGFELCRNDNSPADIYVYLRSAIMGILIDFKLDLQQRVHPNYEPVSITSAEENQTMYVVSHTGLVMPNIQAQWPILMFEYKRGSISFMTSSCSAQFYNGTWIAHFEGSLNNFQAAIELAEKLVVIQKT